jgi:nicotinate phosphoribosyltransferase
MMMAKDLTRSGLLTDLYQLTMIEGYLKSGMTGTGIAGTAVFEFFVRSLPKQWNFLVASGLDTFIDYVESLRFEPDELQFLKERGSSPQLINYLRDFQFHGDIHAMPEGTLFFPEEPILRVTAPIAEGQLLETRAINLLQFQSLIASKAARMILAAPGKSLIDFGLRRAHGAEAGVLAARASYLAGFSGTSNVLAGRMWDLPLSGTMAHSFIQAHEDERTAFLEFARANPGDVTFLLDTYDTEKAAAKIVELAATLKKERIRIKAVRLDSGDLAAHARRVRRILDEGGLREVRIFASGGLDEWSLAELTACGAPIDGYGVGTRLDVSADAPYLDCVYKLQEYAGKPRMKRSESKATWPGRKQVYRFQGPDGRATHDEVTLDDATEAHRHSDKDREALLAPVMLKGRRVQERAPLTAHRKRLAEQLDKLPEELKSLRPADPYPVTIMSPLRELAARLSRAPVD